MLGGGREDVQDATADRKLPAPGHHVDTGIGQFHQPGHQMLEVEFGAHVQGDRLDLGQVGGHRLQQRTHRGHHHRQRRAQGGLVGSGQPAHQQHAGADGVHPG